MILGAYSAQPGGGGQFLAHIVQVTITATGPHDFLVTIHEEGTGLAYRQHVGIDDAVERRLLGLVADLHRWSVGMGLTAVAAKREARDLGLALHRTFLGRRGGAVLSSL